MPCAANAPVACQRHRTDSLGGSRAKPRQSRHRTGMTAHDRGSQVHQAAPMLFDQSGVDTCSHNAAISAGTLVPRGTDRWRCFNCFNRGQRSNPINRASAIAKSVYPWVSTANWPVSSRSWRMTPSMATPRLAIIEHEGLHRNLSMPDPQARVRSAPSRTAPASAASAAAHSRSCCGPALPPSLGRAQPITATEPSRKMAGAA